MADTSGSGATPWLALLIGGLVVAVAALGFFMFTGGHVGGYTAPPQVTLNVKAPRALADHHWLGDNRDNHDNHDNRDPRGHN